jgi:hypothetical protein
MDVSQEPKFRNPLLHTTYYGPVYFRRNSEPYATLALAGARDAGVSVAEVNLTFIWDVVSMIKVGKHGLAYVVDAGAASSPIPTSAWCCETPTCRDCHKCGRRATRPPNRCRL